MMLAVSKPLEAPLEVPCLFLSDDLSPLPLNLLLLIPLLHPLQLQLPLPPLLLLPPLRREPLPLLLSPPFLLFLFPPSPVLFLPAPSLLLFFAPPLLFYLPFPSDPLLLGALAFLLPLLLLSLSPLPVFFQASPLLASGALVIFLLDLPPAHQVVRLPVAGGRLEAPLGLGLRVRQLPLAVVVEGRLLLEGTGDGAQVRHGEGLEPGGGRGRGVSVPRRVDERLTCQLADVLNRRQLLLRSVLRPVQAEKEQDERGRPRRATHAVDEDLLILVHDHIVEYQASLEQLISHFVH